MSCVITLPRGRFPSYIRREQDRRYGGKHYRFSVPRQKPRLFTYQPYSAGYDIFDGYIVLWQPFYTDIVLERDRVGK